MLVGEKEDAGWAALPWSRAVGDGLEQGGQCAASIRRSGDPERGCGARGNGSAFMFLSVEGTRSFHIRETAKFSTSSNTET